MAFDRQHGWPLRIRQQTCGNYESWSVSGWTEWLPGCALGVWPALIGDGEVSPEPKAVDTLPPCLLSFCTEGSAYIDLCWLASPTGTVASSVERLCCCLCCRPDLHAAAAKCTRHPACRVCFPKETTHHPSTGGSHSFTATSATPATPVLSSRTYSIPPPPLRPADAWYDRAVPAEVPAVYTSSGHTLVEVAIDGRQAGLMLLDTGELQAGPPM